MPVTRPLLSCSPFLSFQSAFRASGQSCAQCPWFLHNLHFVQLKKSCSLVTHSPHFLRCLRCLRCSCCFNLYNSQLHLSLPLCHSRCSCLCVLLRLSWRRTVEVGVEFQCIQLSHWVDVCFILWRCRTHRIFMWETCGLVGSGGADTHTDPLSHFSFFLPANSFCTCFLSLLSTSLSQQSTSLSQQSTVCSHFLHTCLTHLQQQPGCLSLLCSTESLTTFSLVRLNVPSSGKS